MLLVRGGLGLLRGTLVPLLSVAGLVQRWPASGSPASGWLASASGSGAPGSGKLGSAPVVGGASAGAGETSAATWAAAPGSPAGHEDTADAASPALRFPPAGLAWALDPA